MLNVGDGGLASHVVYASRIGSGGWGLHKCSNHGSNGKRGCDAQRRIWEGVGGLVEAGAGETNPICLLIAPCLMDWIVIA